jgi:hypothetical protein
MANNFNTLMIKKLHVVNINRFESFLNYLNYKITKHLGKEMSIEL